MKRRKRGSAGLATDARLLSRSGSYAHYSTARKARRRHHIVRGVLVTILAVLVSGVVAVAAYVININSRLSNGLDSSLASVLTTSDSGEPFYMLLLGVDKDSSRESDSEYGSSESAYRSDSIILARIDPQEKKVTLVSIPRDTMVDMGEYGTQKINAAYSIGGASYAVEVVSEFAGVDISHYAEIDMEGMADVVDAVGGVTVNLGVAVYDPDYTGLDLPAGEQTLDGETAALLCRARHAYDSYGGGDYYRAANQRAVIMGVIDKILSSDAGTMVNTVTALADMVTTDMDVSEIVSLATQFRGMDTENDVMTGLAPTESQYIDGAWYEVVDEESWQTMMERVDEGLSPYSSTDEDPTYGIAAANGNETTDSSTSSDSSSSSDSSTETEYSGTVSVLNGSGISGLAGDNANKLISAGFDATAGNADMSTQTTVVVYNGSSALAKANGVIETLGLDVEPVANDGSYSTDADVIVILGSDVGSNLSGTG